MITLDGSIGGNIDSLSLILVKYLESCIFLANIGFTLSESLDLNCSYKSSF
jgi:hypothetical protein